MSDSVRPHRQQPTRLPRPWDSPGKNTGESQAFDLLTVRGMLEAVGGAIPTEVKTQLDGMTVGEAGTKSDMTEAP